MIQDMVMRLEDLFRVETLAFSAACKNVDDLTRRVDALEEYFLARLTELRRDNEPR